MAFHPSAWSLKNPVPTLVLFLVLSVVGLASFFQLDIDDNPDVNIPNASVTVTRPGAAPVELETQVTRKVEDAVATLNGVDRVTSTVTQSRSVTNIAFELDVELGRAVEQVRNAISQIRQELPQDINEPVVEREEFAGGAVMTYAVASPQRSVRELSQLVDRDISQALLEVDGVAEIERLGGVDRAIRVDLDPSQLQAVGLTAVEVNRQLGDLNLNLPGGRFELGGSEQTLRVLGSAETVAQLRRYRLSLPGDDTVPLSTLGEVRDGSAEPRQAALLDGEPVVGFSVRRGTDSLVVAVDEGVRQAVGQLRSELPADVALSLIFSRADTTRDSYYGTLNTLLLATGLTAVTVGLFLRSWRPTLITALALPLSMVPTFAVMNLLGYTLNFMTLLALALAVGNLVDDAIAMNENIDKHLQRGKSPYQAAWDGSREIGLAVVTTTATIVAVFLPVAFMGGVPGKFFQPFGITVSTATLFSTLVALTLTPLLSASLLRPQQAQAVGATDGTAPRRGLQPYRRLLNAALRHRLLTLALALAWFLVGVLLVPYIPKSLTDDSDRGLSQVSVELPPGSPIEDTRAVLRQIDRQLRTSPAVKTVLATARSPDTATVYANLLPRARREQSQQQLEQALRPQLQTIPGARISFQHPGAGGSGKDLSLALTSRQPQVLERTAQALERQMRQLPGLVEVSSSTELATPELQVVPDPQRAADLGVSVRDIARTAVIATIGDSEANLPQFNLPERQIPIQVQLEPQARNDISTLRTLRVPGRDGQLVPLGAVADLRLGQGPARIERRNRERQILLGANLQGLALGDALARVRALPAMDPLPPAVTERPAGNAEIVAELFSRFLSALGLAILAIYAVLVLLYGNFLYPFAILVALPLSLSGALLALLVAQESLGLYALIGTSLMLGLVTKNAILLVDFVLANQQQGESRFKAVVDAGMVRLRPIAMTAVSTVAGMMPVALGFGVGGEVRAPMGITVIGGYTTSTLLTLLVVPVLFTFIDSFNARLLRALGAAPARADAPQTSGNSAIAADGDRSTLGR